MADITRVVSTGPSAQRVGVVFCQVVDQGGGLDEVFACFDAHALRALAVDQQFVHRVLFRRRRIDQDRAGA